jgi:hypothetical protein
MKTKSLLILWILISILFCSCSKLTGPKVKNVKMTNKFIMGDRKWRQGLCLCGVYGSKINAEAEIGYQRLSEAQVKN